MGEEWRGVHGGVDYNRHIVIPVLMYIYIYIYIYHLQRA